MAALQAADSNGGTVLTLGAPGVLALLAILAAAASGWVFLALSRSRALGAGAVPVPAPVPPVTPAPPATPPAAAPPAPPPVEDVVESAFAGAEAGLPDAVLLFREDRVARTGRGRQSLLGREAERLAGLRLADLASAEDVLPVAEVLNKVRDSGAASVEIRFRLLASRSGAGGRDVIARIIRSDGAPGGSYVVTLTDVTVSMAQARAAAGIASRIDAALKLLGDGVMVTASEEGREIIVLFNPGMEKLFGVSSSVVVGRSLDELRSRLARAFPSGALEDLFSVADAPGRRLIETGAEPARLVEKVFRSLITSAGPGGHLLTFRDITGERSREEELRAAAQEARGAREGIEALHQDLLLANEGLERRLADLGRLNRELKAVDEMKSNLLANVSHELQTPLVSIRGYTEMILKGRMGPLTEDQDRGLRVALRNIDRLISLIDSLLTFARAEKDTEKLRIDTFLLRPLVDEVTELLKDRAAEKHVTVSAVFPAGDVHAKGDRDRISQVFINLVSNAIKYNRQGGSVIIEVTKGRRSQARVEIRDTGVGIPREDLDRIFDRYYRGSAEADRGEGSGLGLSITKDILRLHGCMIRADSEPGKGSVFSFTLPVDGRSKGEKHLRVPGGGREED